METCSDKVSVVMPTYNSERYVAQAIESVLNQTYKNIELLVIDDGSTDSTVSIVKQYIAQNPLVKLFELPHNGNGIGAALNYGIQQMTGQWFREFQSDDVMMPDGIEKIMQHVKEHNPTTLAYKIFYANVDFIDEIGRHRSHFDEPDHKNKPLFAQNAMLLQNNRGNGTTVTIHKSAFFVHGMFPEDTWHEDYLHRLQWCLLEGCSLVLIPETVAKYRVHKKSFTQSRMTWQQHQMEDMRIKRLIIDKLSKPMQQRYADYIIRQRFDNTQFPELFNKPQPLVQVLGLLIDISPLGI